MGRITEIPLERLAMVMVIYASMKHLMWAAMLVSSSSAGMATPVAAVLKGVPGPRPTDIFFIALSSLLALGVLYFAKQPSYLTALAFLPQVCVVILASYGGLSAVLEGHYADGVERPWQFIAADQMHLFLTFVFHEVSYIGLHRKAMRWL